MKRFKDIINEYVATDNRATPIPQKIEDTPIIPGLKPHIEAEEIEAARHLIKSLSGVADKLPVTNISSRTPRTLPREIPSLSTEEQLRRLYRIIDKKFKRPSSESES